MWRVFPVGLRPVTCAASSISLVLSVGMPVPAAAQAAGPGRIVASTGNELVIFNTDGTNVVNLTENKWEHAAPYPPYQTSTDGYFPSVSLDGKVAFQFARDSDVSSSHSTGSRIWVMDPDGSLDRLTTSQGLHLDMTFGMFPDDRNPVISPDGGKVCFVGARNEVEVSPGVFSHPYRDLYVVNTDGTDLHQVTQSQYRAGSGVNYSWVQSCVWKPDGAEIAFRGVRLHMDGDGQQRFHAVVGTIKPDGTGETHIPVIDGINWLDGSGSDALDWSPDGRYLLVRYDGAPYQRYLLLNMLQGGYSELSSTQLGSSFSGDAGTVRFSPDSQQLVYLSDNANYTAAHPTFVNVDGTNRTVITNVELPRYYPLWWMPGPAIPTPSRLELTPHPIWISQAGPVVHVTPTLYDAADGVIVRGVRNWRIDPLSLGSPAVGNFGEVVARESTVVGTFTLTATNAGLTSSTQVFVCAPITLSDTVFWPGTVGVPYPLTRITQVGGVGATTFAVTSGALPSGLTLSSGGVVSGTPTVAGILTSFTVTATAADGCTGTRLYRVTIAPASGCFYAIGPAAAGFGSTGGASAVAISAPPGCPWTVANVPTWASTISGASGTGNGVWQYNVTPNGGALRSQTVIIAGQTFELTQLGAALRPLTAGADGQFTLANATDAHWLALEGVAGRSYCAAVAPAAAATSAATPTLMAWRANAATYLAGGVPGGGRACFVAPGTETVLVRVTQIEVSPRLYRLRAAETTLWANWFFIGSSYSSYTLLRNTTASPVSATITWRAQTGAVVGTATIAIPAGATIYYDARTSTNGATTTGSVEVAHNGEPQALVGSQTTLSAATGMSFDTVLMQRVSW